jgi:hypothetical protein
VADESGRQKRFFLITRSLSISGLLLIRSSGFVEVKFGGRKSRSELVSVDSGGAQRRDESLDKIAIVEKVLSEGSGGERRGRCVEEIWEGRGGFTY